MLIFVINQKVMKMKMRMRKRRKEKRRKSLAWIIYKKKT